MKDALQELVVLAPPPRLPVSPGSSDGWKAVESEVGLVLPSDFKKYIDLYGAGTWLDFFGIMNPFYQWKHPQASKRWKEWRELRLKKLAEFRRDWPKDTAPFDAYPAPNGLLAFGYNDNGGTLCWQVTGPSNRWPIVCLDGKLSERFDLFQMSLTEFLVALLKEEIFPKTFAPDLFQIHFPLFISYTTQ